MVAASPPQPRSAKWCGWIFYPYIPPQVSLSQAYYLNIGVQRPVLEIEAPMKDLEHYNSFIPNELHDQNGGVYWSGRASVAQEAEIMLIALNPAGSPGKYPGRTVQACIDRTTNEQPYDWFAPRDARWTAIDTGSTAATAKHTMRRRVLHLIEKLSLDPSTIPAANLVFPRSRRKAAL